jgi:hypothetical protein
LLSLFFLFFSFIPLILFFSAGPLAGDEQSLDWLSGGYRASHPNAIRATVAPTC